MEADAFHLGPVEGDVLLVNPDSLEDSDLLAVATHCQSWHCRLGADDPRAKTFEVMVQWAIKLGRKGLKGLLMESSSNMAFAEEGAQYLKARIRDLRAGLPHFKIDVQIINSMNLGLHQNRNRIVVRGVHKAILGSNVPPTIIPSQRLVPCEPREQPPLWEFGPLKDIWQYLDASLPNKVRSTLTQKQAENIKDAEIDIVKRVHHHYSVVLPRVLIVAASRAQGRSWGLKINTDGNSPSFTTKNDDLFLLSTNCVIKGVADTERMMFRFMAPWERLTLQGFDPKLAVGSSRRDVLTAAGNAVSTPILPASLKHVLDFFANHFNLIGPLPTTLAVPDASCLESSGSKKRRRRS